MSTGAQPEPVKLFALRATHQLDVSKLPDKTTSAHREWATTKVDLLFGGPLKNAVDGDVTGSLHIFRAGSREELEAKLKTDPYSRADVYVDTELREWVCGIRSDPPLPEQLFMVWCVDRPDCLQLRKDTRPRHLEWLKASKRQGLVGPFPTEGGACGSLLLIEGESVDEVRAWAHDDPYNEVNLFDKVYVAAALTAIEDGKERTS